jgi:4-amino-4-deoxy-L-arabinose transferase-like glycosyltransferase
VQSDLHIPEAGAAGREHADNGPGARPSVTAAVKERWSRFWFGGDVPMALAAISVVAFALRIYHATHHDFTGDETPNIQIADSIRLNPANLHLAFTSAGHPLLIVYMAHIGSLIFGKTLLGYRLPMVVIGTLTCWVVYRFGREIGGKTVGLWAAALLAVDQFHVTGSGSLHVHDIPLIFFGALALLSCCHISATGPTRPFMTMGLWMGLAYLGKETALMIWPAIWLFFLISKDRRAVLLDPRWYLAHAIFAAVVAPDVVWNLVNVSSGGYVDDSLGKVFGGGLPFHGKAFSLFIGEIVMRFDPYAFGGQEGYWCWPLRTMSWIAGVVYLVSAAVAWRFRQSPGIVLLELCFLVTFAIVTVTPGSQFFWDPYWWAAMAVAPAVILTGLCFDQLVRWRTGSVWLLAGLVGWLLLTTARTLTQVPFNYLTC